jgi:phosphoenolpyruvate carboxykinase (GTP)
MLDLSSIKTWTNNPQLIAWIEQVAKRCRPNKIHLCTGSLEEYESLCQELVKTGACVPLNPEKRPNSFWFHSSSGDVARVEESTFICSQHKDDAGPTNNWRDPQEMHAFLDQLFEGCMQGRTLYVIPYSLGPLGSPLSRIGVEITDSAYVVCNMRIMTRIGTEVLARLKDGPFVPGLHSVGAPLKPGEKDSYWPCNPEKKYIVHFPEERSIISYGSGYGGNALLGKKSFALRIASVLGKEEGWLAEHMLIMGVTDPEGNKKYFAAAFPSACGKTNLAMLQPALPGWKVECVGDDIAWMRFGSDGRLYAINPEAGFFGVAPGTSVRSNPCAMQSIAKNALFTNVALTPDGDVWWEGMTPTPPETLTDWLGKPWTPASTTPAAHPNARFTAPASQCPVIDPAWQDPQGVPISGIIFGGRRSHTVPLIYEALSWQHGTFIGASVSSEMTAAAKGTLGKLRHDPFAMLPFCGYNMGDYFAHWLKMGAQRDSQKLPRIFHVNWFRKDEGRFLWPGYGENIRVLKWMCERIDGKKEAVLSAAGYLPRPQDLDLSGLNITPQDLEALLSVDPVLWKEELAGLKEYFAQFKERLPKGIVQELAHAEKRLS